MLDEFDDTASAPPGAPHPPLATAATAAIVGPPVEDAAAQAVARLYAAGDRRLRARLLEVLLRPLGPLGLAAVAAGAFAGFLQRGGGARPLVGVEDVPHYTAAQAAELARFAWQVSPDVLRDLVATLSDHPLSMTAAGASAMWLLLRVAHAPAVPPGTGPAAQ